MKKFFIFMILLTFFCNIGNAEEMDLELKLFKQIKQNYELYEVKEKTKKLDDDLEIAKKELIKQIEAQEHTKNRVENINGSIDRFGIIVTIFGVLITLLLILIAWSSRNSAIGEARNTSKEEADKILKEWINSKAENDFAALVKEKLDEINIKGENILKQIDIKSDSILGVIEEKANNQREEHAKKYQLE